MHFYDLKTGEPRYEVATKTKGAKNPTRPAGWRDAKENGWGLSPSTVTDAVKGEQLIQWFKKTWAKAGYEFERNGKPFEEVFKQINEAAESTSNTAKDYGTDFHDLAEKHALGLPYEVPAHLTEVFGAYRDWWAKNVAEVVYAELVLTGDGYGGRSDLCYVHHDGRRILCDYKTQKTYPGKPVSYYETYPVQLAAYAVAWQNKTGQTIDDLQSVIISSTEPGRIESKCYEEPIERYYKLFMGLFEWVCFANDYDPRKANLTVEQKIAAAGLGEPR